MKKTETLSNSRTKNHQKIWLKSLHKKLKQAKSDFAAVSRQAGGKIKNCLSRFGSVRKRVVRHY